MYIDIFNWTIEDLIFIFFYRKGIFENQMALAFVFVVNPIVY